MGVTPLTNAELSENHRIEIKIRSHQRRHRGEASMEACEFNVENTDLKALFADPGWNGEAPLWFYILKEAEIVGDGTPGQGSTLGPVGGRIVAEVLVGLLQKDPNSYLYLQPTWKPQLPMTPVRGRFTMADLLMYAGFGPDKQEQELRKEGDDMQESIVKKSPRRA